MTSTPSGTDQSDFAALDMLHIQYLCILFNTYVINEPVLVYSGYKQVHWLNAENQNQSGICSFSKDAITEDTFEPTDQVVQLFVKKCHLKGNLKKDSKR